MSADSRISVQVCCPHGVFPDGTRRFRLTQNTVVGGQIVTEFQGEWGLTKAEAAWKVDGRRFRPGESSRWELERISQPKWEKVSPYVVPMVQWQGPLQTFGVCNLCALDHINGGGYEKA